MRTARIVHLVAMIASEALGQLIGAGCCRTTGGGLRAWDEPSTAEAIAAKRVHHLPMSHITCAAHCAALKRCTHFELNMYDQPAHSKLGVCSVFASGGYPVTTACKDSSERPRMHCFAKLSDGEENTRESPARRQEATAVASTALAAAPVAAPVSLSPPACVDLVHLKHLGAGPHPSGGAF